METIMKKINISKLLSRAMHHIYYMYLERSAWANSVARDETPQNMAAHQGALIQQFLDTSSSKLYFFQF